MHLHHDDRCPNAVAADRLVGRIPDDMGPRSAAPGPQSPPMPKAPVDPPTVAPGKLPSGKGKVDVQDVYDPQAPKDLGDAGQAVKHLKGPTKDAVENADKATKLLRENSPGTGISHTVMIRVPHEVAPSPAAMQPPGSPEGAALIVPDKNVVETYKVAANWQGADIPDAWRHAKTTDVLLPEDVALHETAHLNQQKWLTMPELPPGGASPGTPTDPSASGPSAQTGTTSAGVAANDLIGNKVVARPDAASRLQAKLATGKAATTGGTAPAGGTTSAGGAPPSSGQTAAAEVGIADRIESTAVAEGMADAVAMTVSKDWKIGEEYFQGKQGAVRDVSKTLDKAPGVGAYTDYGVIDSGLTGIRGAEAARDAFYSRVQGMSEADIKKLSPDDIKKLQAEAQTADEGVATAEKQFGGDDGHQAGTIISRTYLELQQGGAGWDGAEKLARAVGEDKQLWSGPQTFRTVAESMRRNADAIDSTGKLRAQVDKALDTTNLGDAIPTPYHGHGGMRAE